MLRRIATAPSRAWQSLGDNAEAVLSLLAVAAVLILFGLAGAALHRADQAAASTAKLSSRLEAVEHHSADQIDAVLGRERCLRAGIKAAHDRLDHHQTVTALLSIAVGRERPPLWDVPEPPAVTCAP